MGWLVVLAGHAALHGGDAMALPRFWTGRHRCGLPAAAFVALDCPALQRTALPQAAPPFAAPTAKDGCRTRLS